MLDATRKKWQSSGLTDDHALTLKLTPLTGEEVQARLGTDKPQAGGVLIPYFDLDGKPTEFFRIRYLEKLPGFAGVIEKPQRYVQPAKTLNEVYLPPLLPASWKEIAKDATVPIYITEGEFKAAAGCSQGLATIGLGGVDVFRSNKRGIELLPQLAAITWDNRSVVIIYDSDAATNPNVVRAQRTLALALLARGALPAIASLPPAKDGSKQGLDDLLVSGGNDALLKIIQDAPFFPEAQALWELNEEVLYVNDPGLVMVRASGQRMDPHRFAAHHYSHRHYIETTIKNGVPVSKKKPLAKRWIEWERRAQVSKVVYAPGEGQLVDGCFNVWTGWGCAPTKGDISYWVWILDHMFKGKPAERKWFEQWCAYPIQHPGTKLFTYVLLWSVEQGTGKSFLSYVLKGIYGLNGIEIGNDALRKGFNAWQENKQFVIGDEITAGDNRVDADKLKRLIVQPEVHINQKFLPEYRIKDRINYWFNSNHPDAMLVEDKDRRGAIFHINEEKLSDEFWKRADGWLNRTPRGHDGVGPSHVFHHLLHLDLTGFNASTAAPWSPDKEAMILSGKSDIGLFVAQLQEDPERLLRPLGEKAAAEGALFSARQLLRAYDPDRTTRVTEPGMGRELSRAGIRQVNKQLPVRVEAGTLRLYAVRDATKWLDATPRQIAEHYNKYFGANAGKF